MYKNDAPVLLIGIFIRPFKGINHDFSILFFVSKGLNELKSKENVTLLVQYKNNVFNMIFLFFRNLLFLSSLLFDITAILSEIKTLVPTIVIVI